MKFFSSILKQKKLTTLALLFLVFSITIVPQVAQAGWIGCAAGATAGGVAGSFVTPVIGTAVGATVGCVTVGLFGGVIGDTTVKAILSVSAVILLKISDWAITISSDIFTAVASNDILQKSITKNATVVHGWAIVRDFANMFIVLGFVVVGIATILRIREYEAQKTLLPLILVALLINFSLGFFLHQVFWQLRLLASISLMSR